MEKNDGKLAPLPPSMVVDGDWSCTNCENVNFARRQACNMCNKPKMLAMKSKTGSGSGNSRGQFSPEDWKCKKCGNINWARRVQCNMCNAPKFWDSKNPTLLDDDQDSNEDVEWEDDLSESDTVDNTMEESDASPPPQPPITIEGDWPCPDCGNVNFARRTSCNRCHKARITPPLSKKRKLGHEIGKAAAEKSRGLFSADDWQCNKCGNVNWARRQQCNVCNAPKFGDLEERTGFGGGYNDRGVVEYKERKDSDDEYDEFGRKKKRKDDDDDEEEGEEEAIQQEDEEDEEDDDDGDLSKYDLSEWGDSEEKVNSARERSRSPIQKDKQ